MILPGFVGGSAQSASRSLNVERSVNLITRVGDSGTPKVPAAMVNAPGCHPELLLPSGPIRGLYSLNGQQAWAVAGTSLYELFPNHTATLVGSVTASTRPVTWACNGANGYQLLLCSQPNGYLVDLVTGAFSQVVDDGFPTNCAMVAECSGYALALAAQSNQVNMSTPVDFSAWDGLDFLRVQTNDPIVSMVSANNLVYLLGGQQSQVWYPSGDTTPFSPVQGVQIETGTAAMFSAIAVGEAPSSVLLWVSRNDNGQGMVYAMNGYSPQRVSSFAVEQMLQQQPRLDDIIAWTYQQDGHTFAVFYIPSNDTTWAFDTQAPQGMNWAERAIWDSNAIRWFPHIGRCHCFAWGKHLVGSRLNGAIYEMSPAYPSDWIVS